MYCISNQKFLTICSLKNQKEFMKDLKLIYRATSKEDAEIEGTMPIWNWSLTLSQLLIFLK